MQGWLDCFFYKLLKYRQFEICSVVSGTGGASQGRRSCKRLCHRDKDTSHDFSDRDLLTWCWASILDQRLYWSSLNQSVLPSNCVWTFQSWTACLIAAYMACHRYWALSNISLQPTQTHSSKTHTHARAFSVHTYARDVERRKSESIVHVLQVYLSKEPKWKYDKRSEMVTGDLPSVRWEYKKAFWINFTSCSLWTCSAFFETAWLSCTNLCWYSLQ